MNRSCIPYILRKLGVQTIFEPSGIAAAVAVVSNFS
jgi:hypothetical protein